MNSSTPATFPKLTPMSKHAIIRVHGADASKFLQGQCTCDISQGLDGNILIGAHCDAKGRMLLSFTIVQSSAENIFLRVRRSILQSSLSTLKKYSVFFKVEISETTLTPMAILEQSPSKGQNINLLPFDTLPKAGKSLTQDEMILCRHSNDFLEVWVEQEKLAQLTQKLSTHTTLAEPNILDCHLLEQGIVELEAATQGDFIPQHLNYQLIDGISFKKGCYTGQEIIARLQYRGKLKKHTYRAQTSGTQALALGSIVVQPNNPDKTLGIVVASCQSEAGCQALITLNSDIKNNHTHLIEKKSQAKISWLSLPYAIP